MKKYNFKDYVIAVLAFVPLFIIWVILLNQTYSLINYKILIVGTTLTYSVILGAIVFKRLPKSQQEFIGKSEDILHDIKKEFYEKHCASCVKTCGGIESLDVVKCQFKEEYFEAKYEASKQLAKEEDALDYEL